MVNKILRKLSSYIVLIGGIISLQIIAYIEIDKCQQLQNRKKSYCTFIKKTKITSPSKFLYEQINNVVR